MEVRSLQKVFCSRTSFCSARSEIHPKYFGNGQHHNWDGARDEMQQLFQNAQRVPENFG